MSATIHAIINNNSNNNNNNNNNHNNQFSKSMQIYCREMVMSLVAILWIIIFNKKPYNFMFL